MSGGLCIYIFDAILSQCHAGTLSMNHVEPISIFKNYLCPHVMGLYSCVVLIL